MFDTKSSYILSKLGIQRFQRRKKSTNPEDFFGLLWNDILTLLDKSVNELKKLHTKNTKMIWIETPSNPMMNIIDIKKISDFSKKHKLVLISPTYCTAIGDRFASWDRTHRSQNKKWCRSAVSHYNKDLNFRFRQVLISTLQ